MKKIFSSDDPVLCGYLKGIVLNAGIDCVLRNEHLPAGAGNIPYTECWPELWVIEDADKARGEQLVAAILASQASADVNWTCASCGELSEAQFTACWKCGAER